MVVPVQDPAASGLDVLVALAGSPHAEGGVHVHVVARHVQRDQTLEDDRPARPSGTQENQEARGRATIRHHVQDGTKSGGLFEVPSGISVQRIQQTRDTVKNGASPRVEGHVVKRRDGEDDSGVA